jgi:hypothetical protein
MVDPTPSLVLPGSSSPFSHYRPTEKGTSSYQSASSQADASTPKGSTRRAERDNE